MNRLFFCSVGWALCSGCAAVDSCLLPTNAYDALQYASTIVVGDTDLSLYDGFYGYWSVVNEDFFVGTRKNVHVRRGRVAVTPTIHNLYGIFVTPDGVLLYGHGGTVAQRIAPLSDQLRRAGYRRPYPKSCADHLPSHQMSTSSTTSSPQNTYFVSSNNKVRLLGGDRIFDNRFATIDVPVIYPGGVNKKRRSDDYMTTGLHTTTPSVVYNPMPLVRGGGTDGVWYWVVCGGVILGMIMFSFAVSVMCKGHAKSDVLSAGMRAVYTCDAPVPDVLDNEVVACRVVEHGVPGGGIDCVRVDDDADPALHLEEQSDVYDI